MPLLDLFWVVLWLFLFLAWIWALVYVVADIFRSGDIGGLAKALWVGLIVLIPWLGVLTYVIFRGNGMAARTQRAAAESDSAVRRYREQTAVRTSTADELSKLAGLRDSGAITGDEFAARKAELLA